MCTLKVVLLLHNIQNTHSQVYELLYQLTYLFSCCSPAAFDNIYYTSCLLPTAPSSYLLRLLTKGHYAYFYLLKLTAGKCTPTTFTHLSASQAYLFTTTADLLEREIS
jgi:hypothetical protein